MIYFINGTNAWSPTLPMPGIEKRSFPSAITYDNKVETEAMNFTKRFQVWVFGGRDKFRDLNDVYTYTGVWLKHPQARYQRLKIDHFLLIFAFRQKDMMNGWRFGHRTIVDRNSIYHVGGSIEHSGTKNVPIERWLFTGTANYTITSSSLKAGFLC